MKMFDMLPILSICVSIAGFLYLQFGIISKLQERLTCLEVKTEIFWKFVEQKMVNLLISPHNPRMDELLLKLKDDTITNNEITELADILKREECSPNQCKTIAIAFIQARLKLKQEERGVKECVIS